MTFLDCVGRMLSIMDAQTKILGFVLLTIAICCWIITIRFSIMLHRATKTQQNLNSPSRMKFLRLMISTCFMLSTCALLKIINFLFVMQIFHPKKSIDYRTFCGDNGEFYTYATQYVSIVTFIWNIQYVLILTVYYQRLLLIFKDSMFGINKCEKITFTLLAILGLIDLVVMGYFEYSSLNNLEIYTTCWNIFLAIYFILSIYLVFLLRKQFKKLIKFVQSNNMKIHGNNRCDNDISATEPKCQVSRRMMTKFTVLAYFLLLFTLCFFY